MPDIERVRPRQDSAIVGLFVALACILILIALVACGTPDEPTSAATTGDRSESPAIVTAEALGAYPADGPERALLSWFQAVQFKDLSAATRIVASVELRRVGRDALRSAVATVGSALGKPNIVATRRRGDQVALRVLVVGYDGEGKPAGSEPVTFYVRRIAGQWRIADTRYLLRSSEAIRDASRNRDRP